LLACHIRATPLGIAPRSVAKPSPRRAFCRREKITVKSARCARSSGWRYAPLLTVIFRGKIGRQPEGRTGLDSAHLSSRLSPNPDDRIDRRTIGGGEFGPTSQGCRQGAIMVIEVTVPDDWTPGQTLATRQLLQQVIRTAQPVITAVRKDVTADQLKDVQDRIEALIREAGLQAV
jgi:hypothetical protein